MKGNMILENYNVEVVEDDYSSSAAISYNFNVNIGLLQLNQNIPWGYYKIFSRANSRLEAMFIYCISLLIGLIYGSCHLQDNLAFNYTRAQEFNMHGMLSLQFELIIAYLVLMIVASNIST